MMTLLASAQLQLEPNWSQDRIFVLAVSDRAIEIEPESEQTGFASHLWQSFSHICCQEIISWGLHSFPFTDGGLPDRRDRRTRSTPGKPKTADRKISQRVRPPRHDPPDSFRA